MRALIRRVLSAEVLVEGKSVGQIKEGMVVYLGVHRNDSDEDMEWLLNKILGLRIFDDADGSLNYSVLSTHGILAISQFTLFGNVRKGFRPSFNQAASPEMGLLYFDRFVHALKEKFSGLVAQGVFGAEMEIRTVEDGPVNIWIDSQERRY